MEVNYTGGEGLVGDVVKSFGDLNCIFCLLRGDKVDWQILAKESFVE
jgi:hypothetical protein